MKLVQITESVWVNPAHIEAVGIETGSELIFVNMVSEQGYGVRPLQGESTEDTFGRIRAQIDVALRSDADPYA